MTDNHELDFWRGFVKTDQFRTWLSPGKTPELSQYVHDFLIENKGNVLDVGSGVVSVLNGTVDKDLLTSCDLLGSKYQQIFDYQEFGLAPPDSFAAEKLPYDNEYFDISNIRNAIDHCVSPLDVFNEMYRVTKKYIIIQGFEDEAEHERYQGFHQWNMRTSEKGKLYFISKTGQQTIDWPKVAYHTREILRNKRKWITWIAQK